MIGLGRLYTVEFHGVSVTAQQEFFYLKPAADKPIVLEYVFVGNAAGTTAAGDAKEDFWRVEVIHLSSTVTVGSGGNAFTPLPELEADAAAGFTARINDTTKASSATSKFKASGAMNARIGWEYLPPPEHRHFCVNGNALVVRLDTTPNTGTTMNGFCRVREFG